MADCIEVFVKKSPSNVILLNALSVSEMENFSSLSVRLAFLFVASN